MVIREIREFKLSVGSYTDISVCVPCSVLSALVGVGVLPEPYYGTNFNELPDVCRDGAVLRAELEVDAMTLGMDHSFLRICGIDAPATVLVNDSPIATLARSDVPYELDVKRSLHVGKNSLELRFPGRAGVLSDISVFAPIELVSYNKCVIDEVVAADVHNAGRVRLNISVSTKGYAKNPRTVAVLVSPGGSVNYCTIADGKGWIDIPSPNLWRPDGTGDARLYRLTVNLYSDADLIDTKEYRIGLRSVSYDPSASPAVFLSDAPFYPTALIHGKGDYIKPRATDARLRLMLTRAKSAGVNMIYLTGRDSYPSERFLSLCDELGIALSVEIIRHGVASSAIERGIAEKNLYRSLRRFVNHPSVIAIVGGDDADSVREAMKRLLPCAVYIPELDASVASSPSLMTPYTAGRFLSSDDMNVCSNAMALRPNVDRELLMREIFSSYRMPSSFGEWGYLSGVISGELAVSELRKRRADMKGIGVVCGTLGEPMPSMSPSLLDYSSRTKAMYYYLRRASRGADTYAVSDGTAITFYTANMQSKIYKFRLSYAVTDRLGVDIVRDSVDISVNPYCTSAVFTYDASEVISAHEDEYVITYSTSEGPEVHSTGSCMLVPMREFRLSNPNIRAEISGASCEYTVTLTADAYARAVEVYFEGDEDVVLENNFFDITSTVPVRIKAFTQRPTALETLRRELRVRSMYDVGRN